MVVEDRDRGGCYDDEEDGEGSAPAEGDGFDGWGIYVSYASQCVYWGVTYWVARGLRVDSSEGHHRVLAQELAISFVAQS